MTDRVNPVIFVDFPTEDPEAMSAFYEELFGWSYNRRPAGEFHEILPGLKPNMGMHKADTPMSGPVPRVYVMVEDPPSMLRKAESMGATVIFEEKDWAEFGAKLAAFRDPWGAEMVLWRDKGTYTRDD